MKTIGISTICKSENYGACLQSFALYEYIRQKGYDVSIIDFLRPGHPDFMRCSIDEEKGKRYDGAKFNLKAFISQLLYDVRDFSCRRVRKKNFARFNNRIKFTKTYCSLNELYTDPPLFDIYLTGSDQVWCPAREFANDPYLLTFAPAVANKYAYAPSISVNNIPIEYKDLFKRALIEYDSISVRENEAAQLLSDEFEYNNVQVVLDPTFLLDEKYWGKISQKPKYEDYILFYPIGINSKLQEYAVKVSKRLGKKLLYLRPVTNSTLKSSNYISVNDAGPEEMLGLIKNASAVLTDSYHGVIFSILFRVPFYLHVVKYSSRYLTLNDKINIENNFLTDFNPENFLPKPISDTSIELLNKEIKQSQHFLDFLF